MVLVNGHTIYKSIANDYEFDDIDNLNSIDYTTGHYRRRARLYHQHKRNEEKGTKMGLKDIQGFLEFVSTTSKPMPTLEKHTPKVNAVKHKEAKKKTKNHNFWRKFYHKNRKPKKNNHNITEKNNDSNLKKITRKKKTTHSELQEHNDEEVLQYFDAYKNDAKMDSKTGRRKKDLSENQIENYNEVFSKEKESKVEKGEFEKLRSTPLNDKRFSSIKTYAPTIDMNSLTTTLMQKTNAELEQRYRIRTTQSPISEHSTVNDASIASSNIEDFVTPEIAELESLLTEIKQREAQAVLGQNPSVTSLVCNAVTEATFNAENTNLLLRTKSFNSKYALDSNVALNNETQHLTIKRSSNFIVGKDNESLGYTHAVAARSIKDDAVIIAQGIEDKLQCELKKAYKNVKNKLSHDFHKEVKEAKNTVTDIINKKPCKTTKKIKSTPKHALVPEKMTITTEARKSRHSYSNTNEITSTSRTIPVLADDNVMLTLYEQLLAKSHEDNVWKMLSTQNMPSQRHIKHQDELMKRDSKISNNNLNEDIDSLYINENAENDEYPVNSEVTEANEYSATEDTSYEGISNKISYNDYVNGYKYYLKFQNNKDQEDQKYSNLVRYQAHKHHKVDDIGKYILDKIPNVQSTSNRKRFVDSGTLEDQEISTRSEDSWFKKHFFVFIDKEPPKKFHSIQTVNLKPQAVLTSSFTVDLKATTESKKGTKNKWQKTDSLSLVHKDKKGKINDFDVMREINNILEDSKRRKRKLQDVVSNLNDIHNEQSSVTALPAVPKSTFSKKKCGYVDVNLINKPTAVVKLHGYKNKKHRFKGLREKLHLRKRNTSKIVKREQGRVVRFNPVKKFKEIFNVKEDSTVPANVEKMTNYEYVPIKSKSAKNSHLDSVNELLKQIPNITEERSHSKLGKYDESGFNRENMFSATKPKSIISQSHATMQPTKSFTSDDVFNINIKNIKAIQDITGTNMMHFNREPATKSITNDELGKVQIILTTKDQLTDTISPFLEISTPFNRHKYKNEVNSVLKEAPKELSVRTKLTRLAKYPIKKYKNSKDIAKSFGEDKERQEVYEFVDDDRYLTIRQEPKVLEKPPMMFLKQDFTREDKTKETEVDSDSDDDELAPFSTKSIPDYFNDLIMWHNDILKENFSPIFFEEPVKVHSEKNKQKHHILNKNFNGKNVANEKYDVIKDNNFDRQYGKENLFSEYYNLPKSTRLMRSSIITSSKMQDKDSSKASSLSSDDSELSVDTTVLSYDDSLTLLEDNFASKKISKNSVQHHKDSQSETVKTIAKINAAPQQYYNSPLPMNRNDFDKFLKENQLDVESVTAPMMDLPKIQYSELRKDFVSKMMSTTPLVTEDVIDTIKKTYGYNDLPINVLDDNNKYTPKQMTYKFHERNNLLKQIDDSFRQQLNENHLYTNSKYKYPEMKNKNRIIRKRNNRVYSKFKSRQRRNSKNPYIHKLIDNYAQKHKNPRKKDLNVASNRIFSDQDTNLNVFDLQDINRAVTKLTNSNSDTLNGQEDGSINQYIADVTNENVNRHENMFESGKNFIQNNLQSLKQYSTNKPTITKSTMTDINGMKSTIEDTRIALNKKSDIHIGNAANADTDFLFLNKLRDQKDPKSVHISSHTYKYDIVYNEPQKNFKKEHISMWSTPIHFAKSILNSNEVKEHEHGRDDCYENHLAKDMIVDAEEEIRERVPRKVELKTPEKDIQIIGKGDFIYNLKNDQNNSQKNRQKRFKKLSDLLEKLKHRVRYTNTSRVSETPTAKIETCVSKLHTKSIVTKNKHNDIRYNITTPSTQIISSVKNVKQNTKQDTNKNFSLVTEDNQQNEHEDMEINDNNAVKDEYKAYDNNDLEDVTSPTTLAVTEKKLLSNNSISITEPVLLTVHNKEDSINPKLSNVTKVTNKGSKYFKNDHNTNTEQITNLYDVKNADVLVQLKILPTKDYETNELDLNTANENMSNKLNSNVKLLENEDSMVTERGDEDSEVYYEPIIQLMRKRKLKKRKNSELRILESVTPISVTSDTSLLEGSNDPYVVTINMDPDDEMNYEDMEKHVPDAAYTNDDDIYYEPTIEPKTQIYKDKKSVSSLEAIKHEKRDIQTEQSFTAKDVAALEVVVDLVKNSLNYEQKSAPNFETNKNNLYLQSTSKPQSKSSRVTNSIQVHIAIPSNMKENKRSLNPVRIRRVFSAVLSTPVDIKYQIHTFEDTTPVLTTTNDILSPGLYLLVDNKKMSMPKGNYILKPIRNNLATNLRLENDSQLGITSRTVAVETKNLKNNISEDTVAVNKDVLANFMEMYNNIINSKGNKTKREVTVGPSVNPHTTVKPKGLKKIVNNMQSILVSVRHINWEAVKQYFGQDRVCNCRCKVNKTMCRACAASDAVISELIFEFENMAKYMRDHCTEIQTFFWMNPSGGRKLKDTVHKIEKTLDDYYKRVKGKCQGQTCKTFLHMDKRNIEDIENIVQFSVNETLPDILEALERDLRQASLYKSCNDNLIYKVDEFLNAISKCVPIKLLYKRSDQNDKRNGKFVKQVYSLDNINVNIICNSESSNTEKNTMIDHSTDLLHNFNTISYYYNPEDIKNNMKKRKEFKRLFKKKYDKKRKYKWEQFVNIEPNFVKKSDKKRQVVENYQVESPLIADSGGSFWYDYIKKKTNQLSLSRMAGQRNNENTSSCLVAENAVENEGITKNKTYLSDSLTQDIDKLSKIMGLNNNYKLSSMHSTQSSLAKSYNANTLAMNKISISNSKKISNFSKLTKPLKTSLKQPKALKASATNVKEKTKPTTEFLTNSDYKKSFSTKSSHITGHSTSGKNFINRIKSVTSKFLHKKLKQVDMKSTTQEIFKSDKRFIRNPSTIDETSNSILKRIEMMKTDLTTKIPERDTEKVSKDYTTIFIFSDSNNKENDKKTDSIENLSSISEFANKNIINKEKSRDLLFSVLNFESDRLNDEWDKYVKKKNAEEAVTDKQFDINDHLIDVRSYSQTEFTTKMTKNITTKTEDKLLNKLLIKLSFRKENTTKGKVVNDQDQLGNGNYERGIKPTKLRNPKESSRKDHGYICDLQATLKQVLNMYRILTTKKFEAYAKHINCHKYKKIPNDFVLKIPRMFEENGCDQRRYNLPENQFQNDIKTPVRWNWKRYRRSIANNFILSDLSDMDYVDTFFDEKTFKVNDNSERKSKTTLLVTKSKRRPKTSNSDSDFEHFCKYKDGIYRKCMKIIKRVAVDNELKSVEKYIIGDRIYNKLNTIELKGYTEKIVTAKTDDKDTSYESDDLFSMKKIEDYENLCKDDTGIYRECKLRIKRATDISELVKGLRNLPPLRSETDEIYAMVGDTISFNCSSTTLPSESQDDQYVWNTDRTDILRYDNVAVDNANVTIRSVEAKNCGSYICSKDNAVIRKLRLTPLNLPDFYVVFPMTYFCENCNYHDLASIQRLGSVLTNLICGSHCSVRIYDPLCLRDEMERSLLRLTISVTMKYPEIECSPECKRDLRCSLVLLAVTIVSSIQSAGVTLMYKGSNKTLVPVNIDTRRAVVTHTLRRDCRADHKFQKLATQMNPGDIDVVVTCPPGYFLISEQKICVICPANTWSTDGDNTCHCCPEGEKSDPGASNCTPDRDARSCRWHWLLYLYGALALTAVTMATAFAVMLTRHCRQTSNVRFAPAFGRPGFGNRYARGSKRRSPRRYASAPSRVLLTELLRDTSSSTLITDPRDDYYKMWKARSTPPPLPPVDF